MDESVTLHLHSSKCPSQFYYLFQQAAAVCSLKLHCQYHKLTLPCSWYKVTSAKTVKYSSLGSHGLWFIFSIVIKMAYLGAHLAFKSRWHKTDEELCRHSMSFVLHKAIRNDFFESYLYLLEKYALGKCHGVRFYQGKSCHALAALNNFNFMNIINN